MNGQLSEQPLAELIREISSKGLGGRLRLAHDRVKVVAYFEDGHFIYAASNLRTLRLREYLKKSAAVSDEHLARFDDRVDDIDLLKQLQEKNLLTAALAEQVQAKQVADVLRLTLSWTEGTWDFEPRSRLEEQPEIKVDLNALILEAGRRLPAGFAAARLSNPAELITPLAEPLVNENLLPPEAFLLLRIEQPMSLSDVVTISGLGEQETLQLVYSLAVAGLLQREDWKSSFSDQQPTPSPPPPRVKEPPAPPPTKSEPAREIDRAELESFLERVKNAQTHYDVLGVNGEVSPENLKTIYYQLARQYHPDRFRRSEASLVPRLESAFARIAQAYETLRDDGLRASYNSKLAARRKAEQRAGATPKAATPVSAEPKPTVAESVAEPALSKAERAELQFKEGLTALELGQRKVALGLIASAAGSVPNEPRYRALYGQMLAENESTRRAAETELLAAVKLDPENATSRISLAELYRDLGFKLRAKSEAERALTVDPNNRAARELLQTLK
jgi:tetratricopeptide (TPR) repeat protein